jgi:DNA gyrase subunit A
MHGSDAGSGSPDPKVAAIAAGVAHAMSVNMELRHLLSAVIKAVEQSERVRALIAGSESDSAAESMLMSELDLDRVQAQTVLDMQFRRLPAAQRQKVFDEHQTLLAEYAEYESIAASRERQEALVGTDEGNALLRRAGIDAQGQPLSFGPR